MERHRHPGTDREGVFAGDAAVAQRGERRGDAALDANLDQLPAKASEQRSGSVERDDPARVDDRDAIAEPLGLLEVVSGQQDGQLAAAAEAGDHLEKLGPNARIEANRRLVEKKHARVRDEGAGDLEPATLAAAVGPCGPIDQVAEAERAGELVDPCPGLTRLNTPELGADLA